MPSRIVSLLAVVAIGFFSATSVWSVDSHADTSLNAPSSGAARHDARLFAIGALSGSDLVTTYLLIGAMADHFSKGGYTAAQLKQVLGGRIKNNQNVSRALRKVAAMPAVSEKEVIGGFVDAYELLTAYAQASIAFAGNKSQSNLNAYNETRGVAKAAVQRG